VEAAGSLLQALAREPGDRAAVVAFAGRGVLRCPLTEHLRAAEDVLHELQPGAVQPGGTDLAAALEAALDAFDDQEHAEGRTIILFSDGEDLAGAWPLEVDRLRAAHVIVHAVAVGDAEHGYPVPSGRGREPLTYQGVPVVSRRVDRPLEELARATGGAVVRLGLAPADLGTLYQTRIAPIARVKREAVRVPERAERYGLFVLAALTTGLAGGWPVRRRWLWGRGWLVIAGVLAFAGAGPVVKTATEAVLTGRSAFAAGRFEDALKQFETAIALEPQASVPRYNAAAALFRLERYAEAQARYLEARERAGGALRIKIDYALGNTALALGDVPTAIRHYDDCLASTQADESSLAVQADAAINRRFAQEQVKRPTVPPPGEDTSSSPPDRSRDPGSNEGDRDSGQQKTDTGQPPPGGAPATDQQRGVPGEENESSTESPEERLNAALDHIRDAKRRRLPDEPPAAERDRKDW
jgi:Ca-activated chloride channel family protein